MKYALILAGGVGSRFWPLSSAEEPKQFLNICSRESLIEGTISRVSPLFKKENIFVATNKIYRRRLFTFLKGRLSPINILFEPAGRNTLAPIALVSARLIKSDPDAVIAVIPSDHIIKDNRAFRKVLGRSFKIAQKGYIVTMGVRPKRPETGYGYIKISQKSPLGFARGRKVTPLRGQASQKFYRVDKFVEKPKLALAERFIKDRRYFWNSGIFIFRADAFLRELERQIPKIYKIIKKAGSSANLFGIWGKLPKISVDYALMEKAANLALIPADCGWVDIGSWQALGDIMRKDYRGNILKGNCFDLGSRDTFAWSEGKLLATLGLKGVIAVAAEGGVLVCAKNKAQDVRKLVAALNARKRR